MRCSSQFRVDIEFACTDSTPQDTAGLPDPSGEIIDHAIFMQVLEMDDEEDEQTFSKGIVYDFFNQARDTFDQMDQALYAFLTFNLDLVSMSGLVAQVQLLYLTPRFLPGAILSSMQDPVKAFN